MAEQLYRVVFSGELTGEYNYATTRKRFSRLFHIDDERAKALFTGNKKTVIKSNISREDALKLMYKLADAGCESYLEEIPTEDQAETAPEAVEEDGPPGGKERRTPPDRRRKHGREPRPGAIVPDRRLAIRRQKDMRRFQEMTKSGIQMPPAIRAYSNTISL